MTLTTILFFVGFFILVSGAKTVVKGALALSRRLNLSRWVVGLVIVGVGTSLPELSIALYGNLTGEGAIALGTIVGSNTFNILFILGLAAFLMPLRVNGAAARRDILLNLLAVITTLLLASFAVFGDSNFFGITRWEGLVLIILFLLWFRYAILQPNHDHYLDGKEERAARLVALPIALGTVLLGIVGVVLGGNWVVNGAEGFARALGMSEAFIALTIVGAGTSLPELSVSVAAALRREPKLAVGNIIGSNVFDFLGILGLVSLIKPVVFPERLTLDIAVTIGALVVLLTATHWGQKATITRREGSIFLLLYVAYIVFLLLRG